jgi:DNA-binding transcriptional LysR family regulator
MDLNSLGLFVAAAQAGSLSEAARRTDVPLPTLSRRVRTLEADLGMRLFDRGPQGLTLTPAGTQLLGDAAPALASLTQAEQRLYHPSGMAGTLRVSIPPHFEPLWPMLSEFRRRYPAVRLDVFVTDRRVDLVADGVDVAIRIGERGFKSYEGRTLTLYRHLVVAAPALLKNHPVTAPEDLLSIPCGCWRAPGPPVWRLGSVDLRLEPVLVTNDYIHLLTLALSGEAVTEDPPFLACKALQEGLLAPVLSDHPLPQQEVRALVVEKRAMTPLIRRFLEFVDDELPKALENPR